ncbi:MAG: UDP-N-acetylglucosamine--N-acetylmuramyl-(pentapeptide) pyrophosphoryl-undecaprenol N-acetylglucosamine transferase [Candidatus Saccharibacteria bacterium]
MRIILAGGGTGGPVIPLLAVAEEIRRRSPQAEFLFVGTKTGPERELVEAKGIRFVSVPAAKFRRYFSLKNFTDIFVLIAGLIRSYRIVGGFRPDVIFSAGGFVAVPVSWAGRLKGARIMIHQQDARPGLANRLISPIADKITTAFEETAKRFRSKDPKAPDRVEWTGNPVRREFFESDIKSRDFFGLQGELPVLLVFGGGTGAEQLNSLVEELLPGLVLGNQIIHITGRRKNNISFTHQNYHPYEFLRDEMPSAMKLADIVMCRAGLSTISELSALGKVAVVIPIPDSHQEDNARILRDAHAAVTVDKDEFDPETIGRIINSLRFNIGRQKMLSRNIGALMPKDAGERIADRIIKLCDNANR